MSFFSLYVSTPCKTWLIIKDELGGQFVKKILLESKDVNITRKLHDACEDPLSRDIIFEQTFFVMITTISNVP